MFRYINYEDPKLVEAMANHKEGKPFDYQYMQRAFTKGNARWRLIRLLLKWVKERGGR